MDSVRESLKDECLSVILDNFERFYGAFKLSQGSMLGKLFEFLERAYSETLFHKLLCSGNLEEKYLEFLINPHLRRLNLKGFDGDFMPTLLKQLNMIENNVIFLKAAQLQNIEVDHYRQLISSVSKVEVVEISDVIYPEVLQEIGKRCSSLRVLKITNCQIDDDGLMSIFMNANGEYENKVHLEQLDLTSTSVTSHGIAFVLNQAPSLKCLDHCDTPKALYEKHNSDLENNCLENLKKYSLTSLSFPAWVNNIPDTLKICTALCPDVTSLSIDCLENDEQLLLCAKFLNLKDLKMQNLKIYELNTATVSFDGITQFLKLRGRSLFSIHLENLKAPADAFVEHCPKLRSLKFCDVSFELLDNESKRLFSRAKLSNLKSFSIMRSDFSIKETADSVKLIMSNAKNLNNVNFSFCEGLTKDFIHSLFDIGLLQVHELNLSSSDITVPPVIDLLSRGSLQKLFVANCLNITEIDYFNLLSYRGNSEVSISLSSCDEDENTGSDFDDHDDFDVYNDDDFDVYDFDYDHEDCDLYDNDDYDCDYDYYDNYYDNTDELSED